MTASPTPIHREDGELIGYLAPLGDLWVPSAIFGLPLGEPTDRDEAEERLRGYGLGYLAERWEHRHDGEWITVSIVEARPQEVTLSFADYGHPELYGARKTLRSPGTDVLRMA